MEQIDSLKGRDQGIGEGIISNLTKKSTLQRSKARILVVDDEPLVAETLRDLLVFAGFEVETAENGKRAMDLLRSSHHFDLVITDMRMPEMGGLEFLSQASRLKTKLPIIILTGCPTVENGIHSVEEGAFDYVLKPFNTEKLMLVVREALKPRALTNTPS